MLIVHEYSQSLDIRPSVAIAMPVINKGFSLISSQSLVRGSSLADRLLVPDLPGCPKPGILPQVTRRERHLRYH